MKEIIGISSCLAGMFVRYDGASEYRHNLYQQLRDKFTVLTFCPEVSIGLPIPRPPIQLRQTSFTPLVVDKKTGKKDYTEALQNYAERVAERYPSLKAYIFKQSSPSCGLGKTKLHDEQGCIISALSNGIFTDRLIQKLPRLIVSSEDKLITSKQIEGFLNQL